tara:strand:- start:18024 stop:20639 length:2616 start_codon:yes stop_codon:yes gene_type:complete
MPHGGSHNDNNGFSFSDWLAILGGQPDAGGIPGPYIPPKAQEAMAVARNRKKALDGIKQILNSSGMQDLDDSSVQRLIDNDKGLENIFNNLLALTSQPEGFSKNLGLFTRDASIANNSVPGQENETFKTIVGAQATVDSIDKPNELVISEGTTDIPLGIPDKPQGGDADGGSKAQWAGVRKTIADQIKSQRGGVDVEFTGITQVPGELNVYEAIIVEEGGKTTSQFFEISTDDRSTVATKVADPASKKNLVKVTDQVGKDGQDLFFDPANKIFFIDKKGTKAYTGARKDVGGGEYKLVTGLVRSESDDEGEPLPLYEKQGEEGTYYIDQFGISPYGGVPVKSGEQDDIQYESFVGTNGNLNILKINKVTGKTTVTDTGQSTEENAIEQARLQLDKDEFLRSKFEFDATQKLAEARSGLEAKGFDQGVIEFDQTLTQRKAEADALETQRGFQNQLEQDKFNVDRELGFQAQALDEAEFNVQQLQYNASIAENSRQFDEANRLNALAQQEQARATNIQTGFQINQARAQSLDQVRDILSNPADYLARGFALAGQDAPFTPVTQADLINQVSSEYNAYNDFLSSMGTGFNAQEYLAGKKGARPDLQIQAPSMKDYRSQRSQMISSGGRPEGGVTQEDLDYYTTNSDFTNFTDFTGSSTPGSSAIGEFYANNPSSPELEQFMPGGTDFGQGTPPEAEHGGMFGNPVVVGDSSSGKENQEIVMSADGAPMVVLPLTDQQIDILQGKRNNKMPKAQTGGMFGSQDFVGFGQRMGNVGFGGTMYNQLPSGNITQQDIIERAERFGTPRVSRVAQGFRPQPMQFGFPLMTPGQLGSLTPDEREELRTRLASRNVSLGDVETAVMQRFGPTGTRRGRRRF